MTAGPANPGQTDQASRSPAGTSRDASGTAAGAAASDASMVASLSAQEKVLLLTGADAWRTQGAAALGLRPMVTSDGPSGVRGMVLDERQPSSCLPCPSALGATWDADLVYELAVALGREARAKGVDILLAPTVNLMRTPLGGRGFECFAEDPVLTAQLAVSYVRGLQAAGVAATVKHYVGNDSETSRWTYDARIEEHVLRELYLVPFEASVREAGAALVMAAYNKVNGLRMTEHGRLLKEVLKQEWGFDGVVTSDWHAARSTTATALASLDLSMPGPDGPWGAQLARAVQDGVVSEDVLDDKVFRLFRLARRVGALDGHSSVDGHSAAGGHSVIDGHAAAGGSAAGPAPVSGVVPELIDHQLLRRAAAASFVLLKNDWGTLPLPRADLARVTVTGPNALWPTIQGGGSAGVSPVRVSRPAEALAAALDGQAEVIAVPGCRTWVAVPEAAAGTLRDPVTGEPGLRLEFRGPDGAMLASEHRNSATLAWWDGIPPGIGWGESGTIVMTAAYRPAAGGPHLLGASGVGRLILTVDGMVEADQVTSKPADPVEAMTRPGEVRAQVYLQAAREARVRLEFRPAADGAGPLAVRIGIVPAPRDDDLITEAVEAARSSDAAVLVVGSAALTESEGFDRQSLALPGRQDELIRRVAAVNSRTVVLVNAGMPVLMPWADEVGAIIYAWLPGQAMGEAVADVVLGITEPGGRLPVTLPSAEADCPVLHATPGDGDALSYDEGLLIGYRGYDARGTIPRFAFGHGLGYTRWTYESLTSASTLAAGHDLEIRVTVRNDGDRPGREIVQAYLAGPPGDPGRPVLALAAFAAASAGPGEAVQVRMTVPARAFARYSAEQAAWVWPPGQFTVLVGRSSRNLRLSAPVYAR